jgi:phenylalanyl-tRNA synthetase alpha chain
MTLADARATLVRATEEARPLVEAADSLEALEDLRRRFLGKRSPAAKVNESIKHLDPAERPEVGKAVSAYKGELTQLLDARHEALAASVGAGAGDRLDLTAGGHGRSRGHLHLVTQVQRELEDVFVGLGFRVAEGPEVELDWYNFEALNMPPAHPARDMQDTIYIRLGDPRQVLLRTHTSAVQARVMETQPPPVYVVVPGRTYRRDTLDARHSPVFHQIEGLVVDRGITMADLFGTIEGFTHAYFGPTIHARFRPDFFPYTEPSAEFAVTCIFCEGAGCSVCSRTGWIELGGCGMVDPNVLRAVGYDPEEHTGFAFGFGLERMAMIRYGVDHVKTFFENDVRFLRQF